VCIVRRLVDGLHVVFAFYRLYNVLCMNGYASLHAGSGSGWGSLSLALHLTPGINPLSLSQLSLRNGSPSPPTSLFPQSLLTFARQGILQIRSLSDPGDTPESYNRLNGAASIACGMKK
jgi:hypothetical protein